MVFNISLVESVIPGGGGGGGGWVGGSPLYRAHRYTLIFVEWGSCTLLV